MQSHNPAVVVTGASEGIGKGFVRRLRADGLTVVAIARDTARLDDLSGGPDGKLLVLPCDLAKRDAPDVVQAFLTKHGLYVDVLINNAGIGFGGRFDDQSSDEIEQIVAVNVLALVRLSHRFLPDMRTRGRGGLLNIASLAGFMPGPWQALYFAGKAFVLSFSQAVAEECDGTGVHVMVAAPGPVDTRIHSAMKTRYAFYRRLFPSYEPDRVADILWDGFLRRHTVLIPGVVSNVSAFAAAFVPNELLVPIVGFLVRPRLRNGRAQS